MLSKGRLFLVLDSSASTLDCGYIMSLSLFINLLIFDCSLVDNLSNEAITLVSFLDGSLMK